MKFGMNLLLWTGDLTKTSADARVAQEDGLRRRGAAPVRLDGGEVRPLGQAPGRPGPGADRRDRARRGRQSDQPGPGACGRAGVANNKRALDCCQAAGCTHLVGPYHSALGYFTGQGPTKDEWKWGVESMTEVAEYAGQVGVTLGIECLNRFECYLLNTHADAARFVQAGQSPALPSHVRHVPLAHRGEGHGGGDPRLRRRAGPRAHLGERPQHARHRQRALERRLSTRSRRSATTAG